MASEIGTWHKSEEELRAYVRSLDRPELMAQELVQKGAMHAIRFLLECEGDKLEIAKSMQKSLRRLGMVISEECARRGLPVVRENG